MPANSTLSAEHPFSQPGTGACSQTLAPSLRSSPPSSAPAHADNHILTIKIKNCNVRAVDANTDVIQGTLDMLILKTLSLEPMHGFGIARRIEQISRGAFKVNPGSLLTALARLERAGWLDSEWRQTVNSRRAKYYSVTRGGSDSSKPRLPTGPAAQRLLHES